MRGMPEEELLERLRQLRVTAAAPTGGGVPVTKPQIDGVSHEVAKPLDASGGFWEAGSELEELSTPASRPAVEHVLLRRLGPSPFEGAKFPLVGLLATCYGVVSEAAEANELVDDVLDQVPESYDDED